MSFAEALCHICPSSSSVCVCVCASNCHAPPRGQRAKLHYGSLLGSLELALIEFVIEFVSQNSGNEVTSAGGATPLSLCSFEKKATRVYIQR